MKLDDDNMRWMQQVQREWHERLKPNSTHLGGHLFEVPARLTQQAVKNGRLFADRVEALQYFPKGGCVAEIGTQAGWYAEKMLDIIQPRELHLFDLDFSMMDVDRPDIRRRANVTVHQGDSSTLLSALPDAYFDFIYVDGDHELPGVIKDAEVAVRKLKPDGTLVFNDYTPWSIMELNDYGVMPVANGLLGTGEWTVAYFAFHQHMYCDIALKRV